MLFSAKTLLGKGEIGVTNEANENSNGLSDKEDSTSPENTPGCSPGCACGKPPGRGNTAIKMAVCLLVAVAVGAILLYKTTGIGGNASDRGGDCGPDCGPQGCPTSAAPAATPSKK